MGLPLARHQGKRLLGWLLPAPETACTDGMEVFRQQGLVEGGASYSEGQPGGWRRALALALRRFQLAEPGVLAVYRVVVCPMRAV